MMEKRRSFNLMFYFKLFLNCNQQVDTRTPVEPVVCLTFKADAAIVKTSTAAQQTVAAPRLQGKQPLIAEYGSVGSFFQGTCLIVTTTATGCTPLTLAWASAMKKSSVRALCRGSSTVMLVGSWFRPSSIVVKSCHSGRSSVSSQALRSKRSDSESSAVTCVGVGGG